MKKIVTMILLCVFIIGVALTVTADNGYRDISVWYGVNLNVNGANFYPTDVNGTYVPAFIYNGTTYVPIRAISELYGASVQWDGSSQTAYITYVPAGAQTTYIVAAEYPVGVAFPLHLYSYDLKTYLGKCVTNEFDRDSIYYGLIGDYSSEFSQTSIWNTVGKYGSSVSSTSAFNDIAMYPPKILDNNGNFIAYLTTNDLKTPGWTIAKLRLYLEENGQ